MDNVVFDKKSRQKGFLGLTLIESVIVAVTLLAILAFFFKTVNPLESIQKEKDQKRKSDLTIIQQALDNYYKGNKRYPKHSKNLPLYRLVGLDDNIVQWGEVFNPYLEKLPKDPKSSYSYVYFSDENGQSYFLYASLEGEEDIDFCNKGKPCESLTANKIDINACGGVCNYGVSSSNVTP